jgi:hypothetical protein
MYLVFYAFFIKFLRRKDDEKDINQNDCSCICAMTLVMVTGVPAAQEPLPQA